MQGNKEVNRKKAAGFPGGFLINKSGGFLLNK
jgi:hypothetical protein